MQENNDRNLYWGKTRYIQSDCMKQFKSIRLSWCIGQATLLTSMTPGVQIFGSLVAFLHGVIESFSTKHIMNMESNQF